MMRPREWFGFGVRLLGLWFWTQAAYFGWFALLKSPAIGLTNSAVPQREDIAFMTFYVMLGTLLFAGARLFVWLAYGDASATSADADSDAPE